MWGLVLGIIHRMHGGGSCFLVLWGGGAIPRAALRDFRQDGSPTGSFSHPPPGKGREGPKSATRKKGSRFSV